MKAFFIALGLLLHGSLVLAADRLHDIKARGELRVCIWPEYYGISYRNPKSGAVAGVGGAPHPTSDAAEGAAALAAARGPAAGDPVQRRDGRSAAAA